ncbi:MAG: peptide deformylase [Clostridia bacterium]|nr:peptide deformylase [Clostridia bacterium]
MVQELIHDPILLGVKSETATKEDMQAARDLLDTLTAHKDTCVGMAANMIGVLKRIIVFDDHGSYMTMFNPEIIKKSGAYETEEGCLSLLGGPRKCRRYQSIKVKWQTADFQVRIKTFTGWTAQIIQHEVDHLDGILI